MKLAICSLNFAIGKSHKYSFVLAHLFTDGVIYVLYLLVSIVLQYFKKH